MINPSEAKIRQTMYEILTGKRTIRGRALSLGGSTKDRGEVFEELNLSALREYGENYVTTRLGYGTLWVAWLKVEHVGLKEILGFGKATGSRIDKVKEFDDFLKNGSRGRLEDSPQVYTGWVFGEHQERKYENLIDASRYISREAVVPFLAKLKEEGIIQE